MFERFTRKHFDSIYIIFRILVGLLFVEHGFQKLFGAFGFNQVELFSLMGLAGTIELVGGLMIIFGLFTRIAALFTAAVMVGALVTVHFPQGPIPILNGGELAALYLAAFLIILFKGTGKFGLDQMFSIKHST